MALAINQEACINRHVNYPYDIAARLDDLQRARLAAMFGLIPDGSKVLDIGCNSGYIADWLPTCELHGVDVSPALVHEARKRIHARCARGEDLPYITGDFDTAVLGEILEHVYNPALVVAEAGRVATRAIVGSVPNEWGQWGKATVSEHPHHVRAFGEGELVELLSGYGNVTVTAVANEFYVFEVLL